MLPVLRGSRGQSEYGHLVSVTSPDSKLLKDQPAKVSKRSRVDRRGCAAARPHVAFPVAEKKKGAGRPVSRKKRLLPLRFELRLKDLKSSVLTTTP